MKRSTQSQACGAPQKLPLHADSSLLDIAVIFTSVKATLAALRQAGKLATGLGARITLLVPQVVPYPLPLAEPPVQQSFASRRFAVIAGSALIDTNVQIYLCRDALAAVADALGPSSLVIIGAGRRFWPGKEKRWAAALRKLGHEVVLSETE